MIRTRQRLRTVLATALASMLAAMVGLVGMTAPAGAQSINEPLVSVDITGISDPVLDLADPDRVVQLSGTITNTSDVGIRYVNVHFWRSQDPITTSAGLEAALLAGPADPLGRRLTEEQNLHTITREERVQPGETVTFQVRATMAELGLPSADAVYLLGAHVRGIPDEGDGTTTVGRAKIFTVATTEPLDAAVVVSLTAPPSRTATGDFLNNDLAEQITGRLETLLQLAERPGTSAIIDPALLAAAQALGRQHTVAGQPSPAVPAAAAWAQRVHALADSGKLHRFWFGDPDVVRARESELLDELAAWNADASLAQDIAALPVAAVVGDQGTAELAGELRGFGVQRVFARNVVGTSDSGLVGIWDLRPEGLGLGSPDNAVQSETRRLAEGFLAGIPPVYLATEGADVELIDAAPYELRFVPVPPAEGDISIAEPGPAPGPWWRLTDRLQQLMDESDFLLDLTAEDFRGAADLIAAQSWSSQFPDENAALNFVSSQELADLDPDKVTTISARQFVMGGRKTAFPITIANELPLAVKVRLVFDSDAPQRISVPDTDLVTVGPNENLTVNVSPQASANGIVRVEARLQTGDGTIFGKPVPLEITATDLGRVGWIIIVVSGAVVLAGTFLRIRKVQRDQARKENIEQQGQ